MLREGMPEPSPQPSFVPAYSIMPRVKHSASDAVFCATFIHRMHTLNTFGFSSIQCYDKVRFLCRVKFFGKLQMANSSASLPTTVCLPSDAGAVPQHVHYFFTGDQGHGGPGAMH